MRLKKRFVLSMVLCLACFAFGLGIGNFYGNQIIDLVRPVKLRSYPDLTGFSIESLITRESYTSNIEIIETLSENTDSTSYLVKFATQASKNDTVKHVSGLLNLPKKTGSFPLVLLIRGYVDQSLYQTGVGTRKVGDFFAANGFMTVSPDYLGYGQSSSQSSNIFQTRFETYTTTIDLISSLKSLDRWDQKNVFIWAHSNGGQIALASLEAVGKTVPTCLWAPVSKPFPYSVLYYTDESQDNGKYIRQELAKFEEYHDSNLFSPDAYLDKINSPLLIHQGGRDDAVPKSWSDILVAKLTKLAKSVRYTTYPEADHNMNPNWTEAVSADLEFFTSYMR